MRKKIILIAFMAILLMISLCGVTYSRYATTSVWDYYLKSKDFYFTSDYLSGNTTVNVNNKWDGLDVNFNLMNALNKEVVSSFDINYTATCTIEGEPSTYATCTLNDGDSNEAIGVLPNSRMCINNTDDGVNVSSLNQNECETQNYDWTSQLAIANLHFNVNLTDKTKSLDDVIVRISVSSTNPYKKTIDGRFILHKGLNEDDILLNYRNYDNYDQLTLSNTTMVDKCIELSWNSSDLLIDNNGVFSNYTSDTDGFINSIKINITKNSQINYTFYKRNFEKKYTDKVFTLNEGIGC